MKKGGKHSEETKRKMSISHMGKPRPYMSGKNHPFWGKHHSVETKQRLSDMNKGKRLSTEHKRKISQSLLGHRAWNKGIFLSASTRKKMSEAKRGNKHPFWGRQHSEETRKRISDTTKGEKNHNWRGGPVAYDSEWLWQRERVRERDDGICQCCEEKENGRKHNIHHWIPYRLCRNNDLGNLITLCSRCHAHIEYNFIINFPNTEAIS